MYLNNKWILSGAGFNNCSNDYYHEQNFVNILWLNEAKFSFYFTKFSQCAKQVKFSRFVTQKLKPYIQTVQNQEGGLNGSSNGKKCLNKKGLHESGQFRWILTRKYALLGLKDTKTGPTIIGVE